MWLALQDVRDGNVHAIGRCAVDGKDLRSDRVDAQRPTKRQGVPNRTRFLNRRDDRDIAEWAHGVGERQNTFGVHAIIVGYQDIDHRWEELYHPPSASLRDELPG